MKKIFLATISVMLLFAVQPAVAMPGNLVDNGDFEIPEVIASQKWNIYDSGTTGLGWTVEWYGGSTSYGGWTRPETAKLELHRGVNNWLPKSPSQYAELDTDWYGPGHTQSGEPASVKIYQSISTCQQGGYYTLSYAWSPRPGEADNQIKVYWGGTLIAIHTASGVGNSNTVWTIETESLIATSAPTELAFIETATPNSLGMFLDSVSVKQVGSCGPGAIAIDKIANPTEIYPGETVAYTYTVTNAGSFPLSNVTVTDDKCLPVSGPTGDDGDGVLENEEAWEYTCSTSLTETTTNTATAEATDPFENTVQDQDSETVAIRELGCTLTQGYWKTHSRYGPAPTDPTWDDQESNTFDGTNWYNILWTPPKKGNAWYILAHQYIAADLNHDNEAWMPTTVQSAFDEAMTLLKDHTPEEVKDMKGNDPIRKKFIELAEILDDYNNGLIGPPHCSEM